MRTNILSAAVALSDRDLLARLPALAGTERETAAELVAHLAALELRPSLYVALGHGSLFGYCRQELRLSEDAACNRIQAAKACLCFPEILDLLASGTLSLTAVRLLRPHLTPENHGSVLARAANTTLQDVKALVAELAPQADVKASVRKLPVHPAAASGSLPMSNPPPEVVEAGGSLPLPIAAPAPQTTTSVVHPALVHSADEAAVDLAEAAASAAPNAPLLGTGLRPSVRVSAPQRYRTQFTIGQESFDRLRRVQALLRRELPDGDIGAIFERALILLEEKVAKAKIGGGPPRAGDTGGKPGPGRAYENRIRFETDKRPNDQPRARPDSRHIPNAVKRAVWERDAGQCAFVADTGRRCAERAFLEFHHIQPYALEGPASVRNISLRCRRHNVYDADLVFGDGSVAARKGNAAASRSSGTG